MYLEVLKPGLGAARRGSPFSHKDPDGAERRQSERGNAWEVHGKGTAGAFGACGATQATPASIYTDLRPGLKDLSPGLKART